MSDELHLTGIPESIPIERVRELLSTLGIDPAHLLELTVTRHAITARVYATDELGHRYAIGPKLDRVAVHDVVIKVVDPAQTHFTEQYATFDPEPGD